MNSQLEYRVKMYDIGPELDLGNSYGRKVLTSNGHVAEEEPTANQGLLGAARGLVHDVQIRGVKTQGSGWKPISHQVHPQQLYRDQGFRETEGGCEEDTGMGRQA